ncbi:hypothetical protein L6452_42369 [Arctium lappa]|uniref:Uncharacterized protein n=1 Tax=Arctium lappa TaxID=4217 RepID=A0ACB8XI07_ARCLA|nr:hypothetical protein L6452_42369 [Arctium lappa]
MHGHAATVLWMLLTGVVWSLLSRPLYEHNSKKSPKSRNRLSLPDNRAVKRNIIHLFFVLVFSSDSSPTLVSAVAAAVEIKFSASKPTLLCFHPSFSPLLNFENQNPA